MDEFNGRVALVTGSSSGIGAEIARRLSGLGARVVVNSATSVEAGESVSASLPTESIYLQADISDQAQAHTLVDTTVERFGGLDFLINNAGWTSTVAHDDLDGLTDEVFRKTIDVNVFGTWWITKRAIPHLRESADPNIVTVTSVAGIRPAGSSIAYSMSKAALNHMTLLLAKSFGPIRVNAVAPGLVDTPWTEDWDEVRAAVIGTAPLGRPATPEDCAEATLALIRTRYATGTVFLVDGGLSQRM